VAQTLINQRFYLVAKWLSQLKVVRWLNWMPWILLSWVLLKLIAQSSCFAICFPAHIFNCTYMSLSLYLCWFRSTCQMRLLVVYSIFVRSIFMWWRTRYNVYANIISWIAHQLPFRWNDWSRMMRTRVDRSLQDAKANLSNSCAFIDIVWYYWLWASSWYQSKSFILYIKK